jgi:lipopolysaccharide/colanic/teichoic acid biosynthesis glycosyltransferase
MALTDHLYVKEALGKDGKPIRTYKIRTMYPGAERDRTKVIQERGLDDLGRPKNDPRILSGRAWMRRYWVDEVPQLINLVKGDLNLVGVRPMRKEEWGEYPRDLMEEALRYKPGLVGATYAFVRGNHPDEHFDRLREYLKEKRENPLTDLKYFFKVMYNVLFNGVRSR